MADIIDISHKHKKQNDLVTDFEDNLKKEHDKVIKAKVKRCRLFFLMWSFMTFMWGYPVLGVIFFVISLMNFKRAFQ